MYEEKELDIITSRKEVADPEPWHKQIGILENMSRQEEAGGGGEEEVEVIPTALWSPSDPYRDLRFCLPPSPQSSGICLSPLWNCGEDNCQAFTGPIQVTSTTNVLPGIDFSLSDWKNMSRQEEAGGGEEEEVEEIPRPLWSPSDLNRDLHFHLPPSPQSPGLCLSPLWNFGEDNCQGFTGAIQVTSTTFVLPRIDFSRSRGKGFEFQLFRY